MASTYLTRAATGSVSSDKIFTMSVWLKRCLPVASGSSDHWFMHENASSHTQKLDLHFCDDEFRMGWYDGSSEYNLDSKMKFRDTTAWYHIVFRCDTTQATASNRVRLYVNGEQAALQQIGGGDPDAQQPAQNATMDLGTKIICVGRYQASSPSQYFNGYMSHLHYCDGQSYAPTEFGTTDTTTGEWKIKNEPSLTYGNNGFWLFKNDNAVTNRAAGTSSGNFTVAGGTLTKSEDNPSNNFATLATEIVPANSGVGSSNGANEFGTSAAQWHTEKSHFGVSSGKYYFEVKMLNNGGGDRRFRWGFQKEEFLNVSGNNSVIGGSGQSAVCFYTGGHSASYGGYEIAETGTDLSSDGDINVDNAIYGFALDLDNRKMYGHMNGTWFNSGNPSSGSNGIDISSHVSAGDTLFPVFTTHLSTVQINFGNGYTGTSAVSSAGSNASGYGIFEYDVPTGYTALCTKGLNE